MNFCFSVILLWPRFGTISSAGLFCGSHYFIGLKNVEMVDAEITKFAVLSDPRPCFDAIRWSFLVADDSNMQPSTFLQRFMSIIETTDVAEAGSIAFFDEFLDALHTLMSTVVAETFPASWFPTVWTSYCDALCSEAYWLSPYELLLLAMLRDDSLCIFEHVGNHLRLIASH